MKILLEAYACRPNAGSEPGNGWNWAGHLARQGMRVTVFTVEEARSEIEEFRREHPDPNLNFVYVAGPMKLFKPCSGIHYVLWHWAAMRVAKALHQSEHFDIAHHVTYASIHVPTQLWRLGIPTIFGPVGGGQTTPNGLLHYFGDAAISERTRNLLTRSLPYSPFHRSWINKMSLVVATNSETVTLVQAMGRSDVKRQADVAIPEGYLAVQPRNSFRLSTPLKLLWVGTIVPRKGLLIALNALSRVKHPATLTVVGQSPDAVRLRQVIADLGLANRVHWAGRRLAWSEVREAYQDHDALLFTSIRESSGAQLLEAMALGLAVISLDLPGARDLVPDEAGIRVAVNNSDSLFQDLADAIDHFVELSTGQRDAISAAAWTFARKNTWEARAEEYASVYQQLVGTSCCSSHGSALNV